MSKRAIRNREFSFQNYSLEFKVLQNSRMQDAEHADHGLFAAQAEVNGCGVTGEVGQICSCGACQILESISGKKGNDIQKINIEKDPAILTIHLIDPIRRIHYGLPLQPLLTRHKCAL